MTFSLAHALRLMLLPLLMGMSWAAYGQGQSPAGMDPSAAYRPVSKLIGEGQYGAALAQAEQYLSLKPRDPQMRFLKGVIQQNMGQTEDALNTFTLLTQDYPELPEPHNNLAVIYAGQRQYDHARTALESAIRNNPNYAVAHENLGDIFLAMASRSYEQAIRLEPGNASAPPKLALIRELFSKQSQSKPSQTLNPAGNPR